MSPSLYTSMRPITSTELFGEKIFYHYNAAGTKIAKTIETSTSSVDKTTEIPSKLITGEMVISSLNGLLN